MVFKRRQCSRKLKTVHFCKRSPWTRFEFFLLVGVRGIEPLTLCLQSTGPNLSNLAGADATRLNVATSSKTQRALLHLFVRFPFAIWPDLLRLVLRFYYGGGCLNISGEDQSAVQLVILGIWIPTFRLTASEVISSEVPGAKLNRGILTSWSKI
jgi:hypothetical protein